MPNKGQLFKFEQKQQPTFKDNGLDFISNANYDSCSLSCKNNEIRAVRKKGDSIETFTAKKTECGEFIKATKIKQPSSREKMKIAIIYLRKRGMTEIEIAEALGISQSTVSKILNAQ